MNNNKDSTLKVSRPNSKNLKINTKHSRGITKKLKFHMQNKHNNYLSYKNNLRVELYRRERETVITKNYQMKKRDA